MPVLIKEQWKQLFKAMPSHTIRDVEIFAAGEHNGDTYTEKDLDGIIDAFYALRGRVDPPIKIGHSSDAFNREIAKKMGLPGGVVAGDKGEGALAFGWVDNLRRYDNILVADLVNVPESIADLIESQLYRHVSCEIACGYDDGGKVYPYVVSAIALLGAEQQAVSEIKGLDKAMVFATIQENVKCYERKSGDMPNRGIIDKVKAKLKELMGIMDGDEEPEEDEPIKETEIKEDDMSKEINLALGLAEDATTEVAVAEITRLKANPEVKKFSDLQTEVRTYKDRAESAEAKIKAQDRSARVVKYTALASGWKAIAGKPEDMAERIVSLEDIDAQAAAVLIKTYTDLNASATAMGITKPIGTSAPAEGTVFEQKVKELQNKVDDKGNRLYKSMEEAFRAAVEQFPDEYKEYRKEAK